MHVLPQPRLYFHDFVVEGEGRLVCPLAECPLAESYMRHFQLVCRSLQGNSRTHAGLEVAIDGRPAT